MKLGNLRELDRRVIYLFVLLALAVPLVLHYAVHPARMRSAEKLFDLIEDLPRQSDKIVLVVLDYGPNSMAENLPQSEVVIEHLFRRHLPFALFSQYYQAESFLESVPKRVLTRLQSELPNERWEYGKDWINLGYRPGNSFVIQSLAQTNNLAAYLKTDARGNSISELPIFNNVRSIENISVMVQMTSLVGTLDGFLQFFQRANYRPIFAHGCTSITIPQAFIYLDSGQLRGLLEGIAGAAWYSALLDKHFPARQRDDSQVINTGLGIAHLVIIVLVLFGNLIMLMERKLR